MKYLSLLPLTVLLFVACSVEVPSDVISEGRMEQILYDYHQAQGMAELGGGDIEQRRAELVRKVFEKYDITEAEFDSSMVWYCGHSTYLVEIYNRIDKRIQKESTRMGLDVSATDVFANLSESSDTTVIWKGTSQCLRNLPSSNVISFTMKADTTYHLGDTYLLRFDNRFVTQDMRREAYAILVAIFDNDSTEVGTTRIGGDYESTILINRSDLTDNHALRSLRVYFYFNYDSDQTSSFRLWMVKSPMLLRFHHRDKVESDQEGEASDSLSVGHRPDSSALDKPEFHRPQDSNRGERLSPEQMRQNQQGERTINVVRQRKVILPSKNNRARVARPMR